MFVVGLPQCHHHTPTARKYSPCSLDSMVKFMMNHSNRPQPPAFGILLHRRHIGHSVIQLAMDFFSLIFSHLFSAIASFVGTSRSSIPSPSTDEIPSSWKESCA